MIQATTTEPGTTEPTWDFESEPPFEEMTETGVNLRAYFDAMSDAKLKNAQRPRSRCRYVDDPAAHEWTAIIDAALDRMAAIGNPYQAAEWPAAVSACHFAASSDTTIIGSQATFGVCGRTRKQQQGRTSPRDGH